MEDMVRIICPKCKKRAFDITKPTLEQVKVALKCPHCHNIITVEVPEKQKIYNKI